MCSPNGSIHRALTVEAQFLSITDTVHIIGVSSYVMHNVVTTCVRGNVASYVIATLGGVGLPKFKMLAGRCTDCRE